jgi:hypothetical protein
MCILCKEYILGKLNRPEAQRNFWEMALDMDPEHAEEAFDLIWNDDGTKIENLRKKYNKSEVIK